MYAIVYKYFIYLHLIPSNPYAKFDTMSVKDQKVFEIAHILSKGFPVKKNIAEVEHKYPWIIFTFKIADASA